MENHPIPQDVTGFKFKLIGSITIKQFLYLLGFGILTTVAFVLHINLFVKIPLMAIFAGIGISLAFVPIEGRPMDVMLANFAKAIPSENRYVFIKRGVNLSSYEVFNMTVKHIGVLTQQQVAASVQKDENDDKRAMLISRLRNSTFRPDDSEIKSLNTIKGLFDDKPQNPKIAIAPVPDKEKLARDLGSVNTVQADTITSPIQIISAHEEQAKEKAEKEKEELISAQREAIEQARKVAEQHAKEEILKNQALAQKEDEERMRKKAESELKLTTEPKKNTEGITVPQTNTTWAPSQNLAGGFPSLPDVPNIVLGIVRDSRGKSLPNVLVEVVDPNKIPVRAFKTNALGQFASATPLPNGSYKIFFDDPLKQHEFAPVDIEVNGEIFQPIEAISVDAREKLRRELFDKTPAAALPGISALPTTPAIPTGSALPGAPAIPTGSAI